jgi:hypothetical protein
MRYSQKLRQLASWCEDHPDIDEKLSGYWDYPSATVWLGKEETEEFGRLCRAMGTFEKSGSYGTLAATVRPELDGEGPIFQVRVNIDGQCEKRVKVDENGFPVTRKTTKTVTLTEPVTEVQEVEEPEYEWKCPDSFLSL